jgi:plasmid stability protein
MPNLSIRGLDERALAELKRRAAKENASVNALVVSLIEQGIGQRRTRAALQRHGDLDELAGTWSKSEASAFERATAAFREVDSRPTICRSPPAHSNTAPHC